MSKTLNQKFFNQNARKVALELLKSKIVREIKGKRINLEISEVEIYEGFKDKASHASKGKTKRNELMFEKGGVFYVYMVYGMHFMLNVVVDKKDYPAAILIRGAGEFNGPGKLTRALKIDCSLNGKEIKKENGLWFKKIERKGRIKKTPRIGVDYSGDFWKNAPLRYIKTKQ